MLQVFLGGRALYIRACVRVCVCMCELLFGSGISKKIVTHKKCNRGALPRPPIVSPAVVYPAACPFKRCSARSNSAHTAQSKSIKNGLFPFALLIAFISSAAASHAAGVAGKGLYFAWKSNAMR